MKSENYSFFHVAENNMDSEIQSSDLNSDQQDEPKAKKEKLDVLIERNDKEGKITLRKVTPVTTEVENYESVNSRTTQKILFFTSNLFRTQTAPFRIQ